jgi:flagellar biogenesis protein FliO
MSTSLLSLMLAAQGGLARYEAWRGRRFIGLLLGILLILGIIYMVKRIMSK